MALILGRTYNNHNRVYLAGAISLCPKGFLSRVRNRFVLAERLPGLVWPQPAEAHTALSRLFTQQHPPPPGLDLNSRMGPASQNLGLGTMTAAPAQSRQDLFPWIFHIIDSEIGSDCPCTLGGLPGAGWELRVTLCLSQRKKKVYQKRADRHDSSEFTSHLQTLAWNVADRKEPGAGLGAIRGLGEARPGEKDRAMSAWS